MTKQLEEIRGQEIELARPKPIDEIRNSIAANKGEFSKVLPAHITFEKFQRTVMTAIVSSPDLLQADRQSLLVSCMKAATDGLLPDGRDAALVIFNAKVKTDSGDRWIKKVQYMPMYAGILKKIRQSEELVSLVTHVVYERDSFEYILGDDERITHQPYMGAAERGGVIAAYCIAKLKDGSFVREVMTRSEIEKVRRTSKSGDDNGSPKGIWKEWYEEMARKTVFRRAAKWLPQSAEIIDRAFKNDDTLELVASVEADKEMIEAPKQPDLKNIITNSQPDSASHPAADVPQ